MARMDGREFRLFPQILLAAEADELEDADRVAATARAG